MVYFLLIVFFVILFIFSSKKLSPIPYFPSQKADLPLIIKALGLKNNQTVFDLGAGDGIVIFNAAKVAFENKLNTKFIAVEINPILIMILQIRRLLHPNKKNIQIIYADIFNMNFKTFKLSKFITIYLYISPWYLKKTILNIKKQIENYKVVSYMYPIKSLKNKEKITKGKNKIYVYQPRGLSFGSM